MRTTDYTQEQLNQAHAREQDFVRYMAPAVKRCVCRKFAGHKKEEIEEAVQDATFWAWKRFISLIRDGCDPLEVVGFIVIKAAQQETSHRTFGDNHKNYVMATKAQLLHGLSRAEEP